MSNGNRFKFGTYAMQVEGMLYEGNLVRMPFPNYDSELTGLPAAPPGIDTSTDLLRGST
jgi:hypothetical protein